jgi:homoserine kinase
MGKPVFRAGSVHARVPATSANLGPGFDALGLAVSLYDDVLAAITEEGLVIDVAGEGEDLPRNEKHLVVRAMRATFDRLGGQPRGLQLSCANRIPHGRGLGSSAAAIVSGVLLARGLVLGGEQALPMGAVLELASEIEGHPDNVAACLLGGLTVAWSDSGVARAVRVEGLADIHPVLAIPPFESNTKKARGLLPETVPHADAAFAAGRSALLIAALTAAPEALLAATEDRLHQPYRVPAMRQSAALVAKLRVAGLAAVVSGAGPTVLTLARDQVEVESVLALVPATWSGQALEVATHGAHLVT